MSMKIKRLEESNLTEKSWQLKGETTSKQRPVNSLLEEHLTFDHTSVGGLFVSIGLEYFIGKAWCICLQISGFEILWETHCG